MGLRRRRGNEPPHTTHSREVTVASTRQRRQLPRANVMEKMLEEQQSAQPKEHRQGEQAARAEEQSV